MAIFKNHLHLTLTVLLFGLLISAERSAYAAEPSVLVDTKAYTLTVLSASKRPLIRFRNIAVGRGGTTDLHRAGDATTPLGTFHVAWINPNSRFGIFFGLNYPTPSDGARALALGIIGQTEYDSILSAHRHGYLPPQNTALGGQIGIHGIGEGNPEIQKNVNWTSGCIALSNADAVKLARWVHIGTKVTIR